MSDEYEKEKLALERKNFYFGIAKMYDDSVKSRREYEWKLAFGFWTAIGVFTRRCGLPQSYAG